MTKPVRECVPKSYHHRWQVVNMYINGEGRNELTYLMDLKLMGDSLAGVLFVKRGPSDFKATFTSTRGVMSATKACYFLSDLGKQVAEHILRYRIRVAPCPKASDAAHRAFRQDIGLKRQ